MIFSFKNIIKLLYDKYVLNPDTELTETESDARKYRDNKTENVIAIVCNALATMALADSTITIIGDTDRAELLKGLGLKLWQTKKKDTADALGTGMVVAIPYGIKTENGYKLYADIIPKDYVFITDRRGDEVTQISVISDYREHRGNNYIRVTDYSLDGSTYVIKQRCIKNSGIYSLKAVDWWKDIPEEIRISGVDRLPVGILKCPTSNRRPNALNPVPITYGCGKTLDKITKTLNDIEKEFSKKETKIFADPTLLDKDQKIDKDVFIKFTGEGKSGDFFEVFSPQIYQSSYYEKLNNHFAFLEKQIGCSRGILTDMQTQGATATEIKRAMLQTFSLCDDIQSAYKEFFEGLMYGFDVLADYYGITAKGEWEVKADFNYALAEDPQETYSRLLQAQSIGAASKAEIRSFNTGRDVETCEEEIKQIEEKEPKITNGAW